MINGRPANERKTAFFYKNGVKQNIGSLEDNIDATGWCYYLGNSDDKGRRFGEGKSLLNRGGTFIGTY